jgi:hypothetical protein
VSSTLHDRNTRDLYIELNVTEFCRKKAHPFEGWDEGTMKPSGEKGPKLPKERDQLKSGWKRKKSKSRPTGR